MKKKIIIPIVAVCVSLCVILSVLAVSAVGLLFIFKNANSFSPYAVSTSFLISKDDGMVTNEEFSRIKDFILLRVENMGIVDYTLSCDSTNNKIYLTYVCTEDLPKAQEVIETLSKTQELSFCHGTDNTEPFLTGEAVKSADSFFDINNEAWVVSLEFNNQGTEAFADATTYAYKTNSAISIYLDERNVSTAYVNEPITNGEAIISGSFTEEEARELALSINSGAINCNIETQPFEEFTYFRWKLHGIKNAIVSNFESIIRKLT